MKPRCEFGVALTPPVILAVLVPALLVGSVTRSAAQDAINTAASNVQSPGFGLYNDVLQGTTDVSQSVSKMYQWSATLAQPAAGLAYTGPLAAANILKAWNDLSPGDVTAEAKFGGSFVSGLAWASAIPVATVTAVPPIAGIPMSITGVTTVGEIIGIGTVGEPIAIAAAIATVANAGIDYGLQNIAKDIDSMNVAPISNTQAKQDAQFWLQQNQLRQQLAAQEQSPQSTTPSPAATTIPDSSKLVSPGDSFKSEPPPASNDSQTPPIRPDNAQPTEGGGIQNSSAQPTPFNGVFIDDIFGRVADRTDPFANSPFDIWRGGGSGGSSLNAALSQLLAMANADLAAGRACLANPEGCSGTLPYSPGQVQTVANQVLKAAGANAVNARAAGQTVNSPSGATPSSTISGLSAQRPGSPTAVQRIAVVAPTGSNGGVEPTNSTVHTTVAPQLSPASHGNPNPPSGAAPGANAGGIGSVAARTGSAASSAAARGASSAASSATSQAASAAAANAASRAASNAASRTASAAAANAASRAASAAAANAASRAASAAAANAASRVRIPTVSDIRLKRDIVEVGQLPDGLHLYRYRYLWSDTVYVGVMAQEVLTIAPDAVVRGDDGYLRVDYGRLGLRLTTWDQWTSRGRERATDRQ
jgi:hypothetical protein